MDNSARERAVWNRVTAAGGGSGPRQSPAPIQPTVSGCEPRPVTNEDLIQMIQEELCDSRTYRLLSRRFSGCARNQLWRLAQDERGHAAALSALYYLRTGENACVRCEEPLPGWSCPAEALRLRYDAENAGAAEYARAAQVSADEAKELFERLSCEERQHRATVFSLLEQLQR